MKKKQKKQKSKSRGKVYFVGAGPGDPGLLTLRGAELLAAAKTVIYDGLVNRALLQWCPSAVKISAAKSAGVTQEQIHHMLVRAAGRGGVVVRLKGGDPIIFGRGAEEAACMIRHRIPFEFVPGITAGIAVPAYAGIPLTDRHLSSQVLFVTGHEDPAKTSHAVDWKALARFRGTLVSYMAVANLPEIVKRLRAGGMPAKTPAAVIERGTLPDQRVAEGTLGNIAAVVKKMKLRAPALAVIGAVSGLRRRLAWFKSKPLSGKTILVTRPRAKASGFTRALEREGARVLEFSAIKIEPPKHPGVLDRAVASLPDYDWIVFSSVHGVEFVWEALARLGRDARHFGKTRVAAMGSATARALHERGIKADFVPSEFHAASLVRDLKKRKTIHGQSFLLPQPDRAPAALKDALTQAGARVTRVTAYRTLLDPGGRKQLRGWLQNREIDFAVFTSASTVDGFMEALGSRRALLKGPGMISIGPVTSRALRRYGARVLRQASPHNLQGLLDSVLESAKRKSR